jgi:hypothetical protein
MEFAKTVRWGKFLRELRVAVPTLLVPDNPRTAPSPTLYVDTDDTTGRVFITPPPGASQALRDAIAAAVSAHDSTTPDAFETTAAADQTNLDAFPTRAQVTSALAQIDADLVTLGGVITLAQAGPILRRTVQNQKNIIQALAVWVYRNQ